MKINSRVKVTGLPVLKLDIGRGGRMGGGGGGGGSGIGGYKRKAEGWSQFPWRGRKDLSGMTNAYI